MSEIWTFGNLRYVAKSAVESKKLFVKIQKESKKFTVHCCAIADLKDEQPTDEQMAEWKAHTEAFNDDVKTLKGQVMAMRAFIAKLSG